MGSGRRADVICLPKYQYYIYIYSIEIIGLKSKHLLVKQIK